jgi:hypothetical protein
MAKYEWKKEEKGIYLPKASPTLLTVPKMKFFTISGNGNPNNKDFQERIGVLYSLSYAVRMMPKSGYTPSGYFEYTVYPLEGIWSGDVSDKDSFVYTIMIRQPDFVNNDIFGKALETAKKKKPNELIDGVNFETVEDGLCVQMLHIGSYDSEPQSFEQMRKFTDNNSLKRKGQNHREIYLSNANKTEPGKLKTVLRYFVTKS